MVVRYTQNVNDYYNASKYIGRYSAKATKWRYLATVGYTFSGMFLGIGALMLVVYYKDYGLTEPHTTHMAIAALLIAFFFSFLTKKLYFLATKSLIFEDGGLYLSQQEFAIGNNYLTHSIGDYKSTMPWKYINRIVLDGDCIYLFIDRGIAMYIPRHAFDSNEEYIEFAEALSSHANSNN